VEYQYDKTTSIVRIGISGAGIVPNYIIETPIEPVVDEVAGQQLVRGTRRHVSIENESYC
jgi:hypothetical protein